MSKLDELYRQAGWGRITDAALNIEPQYVESQARDVARFAYKTICKLMEENARLRNGKEHYNG